MKFDQVVVELMGTELDGRGWEAINWAMSCEIWSGGGGIDGAVDDMWHVWLPRYVTSNM